MDAGLAEIFKESIRLICDTVIRGTVITIAVICVLSIFHSIWMYCIYKRIIEIEKLIRRVSE